MLDWCACDEPMVRCDNRGCICQMCGLPENPLQQGAQLLRPLHFVRPEMSRSYPYKWIADYWKIDYGVVLGYTDAINAAVAEGAEPMEQHWQQANLSHWQRHAVEQVQQLPAAVRVDFKEMILDARQLWLRAQLHGMAAALAA